MHKCFITSMKERVRSVAWSCRMCGWGCIVLIVLYGVVWGCMNDFVSHVSSLNLNIFGFGAPSLDRCHFVGKTQTIGRWFGH